MRNYAHWLDLRKEHKIRLRFGHDKTWIHTERRALVRSTWIELRELNRFSVEVLRGGIHP